MPTLPLPRSTTLSGGDLPVSSPADVLAEFPGPHRAPDVAPVRDAFVEAFTEIHVEYQNVAERAAASVDPLRATGDFLRDKAAEYGVIPAVGESNASVRERMFQAPEIVTPEAIENAVNAVIAPKTCRVLEGSLDGWFVHADTTPAVWDSFVGAPPNYPDRFYDDLPGSSPTGCAVFDYSVGRRFTVLIPVVGSGVPLYVIAANAVDEPVVPPFFCGVDMFVPAVDPSSELETVSTIVGRVQAIKGQGISWGLFQDATL